MSSNSEFLKTEFQFGSTTVRIREGNILAPGVDVDAVVSTDDNYLTMGNGVARLLAERAGAYYVRAAQAQCPVKAGTVVTTKAYRLSQHGLDVKHVLHGAVIDYDSDDLPLEQVVYQVTTNCLEEAEKLKLESILFPALATGSGGLPMAKCARQMCSAIKAYLARERPLKAVYIILYLPKTTDSTTDSAQISDCKARNQSFIREANLILGVPYDPALHIRQTRDFFGRDDVLKVLEDIITGKEDDQDGKRHAAILGGPGIGKSALLDQIYCRAQQRNSVLSRGQRLVNVGFGRVHENTPAKFIYRKLLCSLGEGEDDPQITKELRRAYADPKMNCNRFLKFLRDHKDCYPQVVLLVNHLPRLLKMGAVDFWRDLDRLEERVRFVFTATDDEQYQALRDQLSDGFKARLKPILLKCVTVPEREAWVNALYQFYLGRSATDLEQRFFEKEAGQHPSLISLVGYALIERIVRDRLDNPNRHPEPYDRPTLAGFFRDVRKTIERPRRRLFALLVESLDTKHRSDLRNLARAVAIEEQERLLQSSLERGDPDAMPRWQELQEEGDPRENLHDERLDQLEKRGYLRVFRPEADKAKEAQFMAKSFADHVAESLGDLRPDKDRPTDVVINLLSREPGEIRTMFRGRGARVISAQKKLSLEVKDEFMKNFGQYVGHQLHPNQHPDSGAFRDLEEIGNYILAQFTNVTIKRYLESAPEGSTILLMIDDAHKDIPWELMLEAVYAGPIPFRVGRSVVSQQEPHNIKPPVRGISRIKALLIGDPTCDLPEARHEVKELADRFQDPDVLIGPEHCQRIRLLNALASGNYGLVHYSGHTRFEDDQSAWQLKDSKITTDMLTNAVQMAPPAFIFSSSCESAASAAAQPIRYEDQTFDLPSAFLQAGVEAYIGTLWGVDSKAARLFTREFYEAFLSGDHNLGECLRRAKWALKQREEREGQINWLAFILYGDPHTMPGDLFPALRKQENSSND